MSVPDHANRDAAAAAIDAFLRAIGRKEADLQGTGDRVAEMFMSDLCAGYAVDTRKLIADASIESSSSASTIVTVRDIPLVTTCPHHLVPSIGKAFVAFKAGVRLVGLGAVAALVDAHARRLTLQERLGEAVVDDLNAELTPEWVACRLVLSHGCMIARGERAMGSYVETIAFCGSSPKDHRQVAEAHRVLGVGGSSS